MIEELPKLRTEFNFDAKLVAGWIVGTYQKEFIETIELIHEEINYNRNKINILGLTENITKEVFFDVFNTYYHVLFNDKKLLEYNPENIDKTTNLFIINEVSKATGRPVELVTAILNQLYWSTAQNRVKSSKWIRPKTFMKYEGYRQLRADAVGSEWGKKLIWILAFIAIGVGGFYILKAYMFYKTTKSVVSPKRKMLN